MVIAKLGKLPVIILQYISTELSLSRETPATSRMCDLALALSGSELSALATYQVELGIPLVRVGFGRATVLNKLPQHFEDWCGNVECGCRV